MNKKKIALFTSIVVVGVITTGVWYNLYTNLKVNGLHSGTVQTMAAATETKEKEEEEAFRQAIAEDMFFQDLGEAIGHGIVESMFE